MIIRPFFVIAIFFALILQSCGDRVPVPKPRSYPRVEFPDKTYKRFDITDCPFSFDYPTYGIPQKDSLYFNELSEQDCWFDIVFPTFNAKLHCSYFEIESASHFEKLSNDSYKIASKINQRSDYMMDSKFKTAKGINGMLFEYEGPAASSIQFVMTDTTTHFMRGALYFNAKPRPDSLSPILSYFHEDVDRIISSFIWEN